MPLLLGSLRPEGGRNRRPSSGSQGDHPAARAHRVPTQGRLAPSRGRGSSAHASVTWPLGQRPAMGSHCHAHLPDSVERLGPSITHLVRVRTVLVRHNFCLPMTHQVHLGREYKPGSLRTAQPLPRRGAAAAAAHGQQRCGALRDPATRSLTLKWSKSSAVTAYGAPITTSDTYCGDRDTTG